jgi:hypothetical protein
VQVADFAATTTQHEDDMDRDDAFECLHHFFAHLINGVTVGQWLARALHAEGDGRDRQEAERVVDSLDVVIRKREPEPGVFLLKGAPGLDRIFANTKWAEGAWVHAIKKLNQAFSPKNPIYFPTITKKARAIGLPLDLLPEPSFNSTDDDGNPGY